MGGQGGGGREREELEVEGGEKGGFNFGIKVWKPRNLYRTFKLNECAQFEYFKRSLKIMERQIIQEIKYHIIRELSCQKFKKNDILTLFKKIFGTQTNIRKQEMAEKLADKVCNEIQSYINTFDQNSENKAEVRSHIIEFVDKKLKELEIRDITRSFLKKLEEAFSCELTEEIMMIFNHRPLRANQEVIESVWSDAQNKFIDCLCPKPPPNLNETKKIEECNYCGNLCHMDCFWSKEKDEAFYECPFCYLRYCLPNREVKSILFAGYLPILKKQKTEYKIHFSVNPKLLSNKNLSVEIRCAKLHNKSRYEITWPDNCTVLLGKHKLEDFKPLMTNSPLKRRNDEPIKISKDKLGYENDLVIEEKNVSDHSYRSSKKSLHLVTVMLVSEINKDQVQNQFLKRVMRVEESKEALKSYLEKGSQELKIEKISVSLRCQYYGNRMKYPVRSKLCTSHYQPFDLHNFIYSSIFAKTSTKKWKCPICDKRAYDIVIDEYILDLMNKNEHSMEITFIDNGDTIMNENVMEIREEECKKIDHKKQAGDMMCIDIDESLREELRECSMDEEAFSEESEERKIETIVLDDDNSMPNEDDESESSFQKSSMHDYRQLEKNHKKIQEIISSEPNIDEEYVGVALSDNESHLSPPKRNRRLKERKVRFGEVRKKRKNNDQSECPYDLPLMQESKQMEIVEISSSEEEPRKKKAKPERSKKLNQEPCTNNVPSKFSFSKGLANREEKRWKKEKKPKAKSKKKEQKQEVEVIVVESEDQKSQPGHSYLSKPEDWPMDEEQEERAQEAWAEYERMHKITLFDMEYQRRFEGCEAVMDEGVRRAINQAQLQQ